MGIRGKLAGVRGRGGMANACNGMCPGDRGRVNGQANGGMRGGQNNGGMMGGNNGQKGQNGGMMNNQNGGYQLPQV